MSTLLLQLSLKQWDKSRGNPEHETIRANLSTRHTIQLAPQFAILNTPCVLEQRFADFTSSESTTWSSKPKTSRKIKTAILKDGSALLDRFIISQNKSNAALTLGFLTESSTDSSITIIGELSNGWIESKYQWRYRTEHNNEFFWLYEEVTLNIALVEILAPDVFLEHPPAITFNDV